MMEDRLNDCFLNMGYQRMNSNAQGIYLFFRAAENGLTIVSVMYAVNGNEITVEQYGNIINQIKKNFASTYPGRQQLLSLILTRFPDRVKQLCSTSYGDGNWIIDLSTNRLMLYETESYDFSGLKGILEQLLEDEQSQRNESEAINKQYRSDPNYRQYNPRIAKTLPFTLMNVSIIVINIIAYIVMHFTSVLGGEGQMLAKGALSWYYVINDKEYYRVITSMFMHADWSHLFNNMLVLLFVGVNLERAAGKLKFVTIYFGTGIIAGIVSISYNMWKENAVFAYGDSTISIGASGAIFGVVGAILYIVIVNKGRLEQFNTRQMVMFIILSLYSGLVNSHIDQAAHIGGFLGGLVLAAILYRRPGNRTDKTRIIQE